VADVLEGRREDYRLGKRYLRPDGSVVQGDLSVACVRDTSGAVTYFISQIQDGTLTWELGERQRLLAENVNDVVVLGDNDGVIVWTLPSVTKLMGWSPEEMAGVPFRDFVHPDDVPTVAARQAGLARGELSQFEVRLRRKPGDYRWMNVRVRPILDEHGVVVGRVAGWWDAEEQHAAADALAHSRERYRAALAGKLDPHVFLDAVRDDTGTIGDFVYSDANVAALTYLGLTLDELRSTSLLTLAPHQRESGLFDMFVRTVELGEDIVVDEAPVYSEILRRKAWLDFRGARVGDGLSLTWREVTERVQVGEALAASEAQARDLAARYEIARDEAEQANLAKTVFLSRMSHELRTPLNAILGFAQLLAMDDLTDDQGDAVRQIRSGGKHLLGLITEILDISRIESGRLSLSMESVVVADAVDEALDLVRPLAAQAGVSISRQAGPDGLDHRVWADRQRVIQILLNLLSNAVKYNRRGGSVTVTCRVLDDRLVAVRVADTGAGLTADQLAHVFEPFDRLGAERTMVEGTGIGLTLSQGLARIMSGRLEVTSVRGEGSMFTLVLPGSTLPAADAVRPVEHPIGTATHLTRVLYIEDNPTNTHLMQRIAALRAAVHLRAEVTGAAGLAAAADERPDLVLLDLHLPDMSGETVLTRLLDLPTMDGVRVVVLTADATPGLDHRLKALGADAVLTKPVDVAEVLAWIDHPTATRYRRADT
jgi:PAS domain S-box-containing protein